MKIGSSSLIPSVKIQLIIIQYEDKDILELNSNDLWVIFYVITSQNRKKSLLLTVFSVFLIFLFNN